MEISKNLQTHLNHPLARTACGTLAFMVKFFPSLGFYELQLLILTSTCITSLCIERYVSSAQKHHRSRESADDRVEGGRHATAASAAALAKKYLLVYAIVMGADWLQGPYLYSLYREQYEFPERIVAMVFVTGFLSAGIAAPFVGVWADQYGRRRLCLVFCVTYTITCLCFLIPVLPILLLGRILGGISTSILFSAFESWLISSATSLSLPSGDLSGIMGRATLVNGFVATGAGIVSNKLVSTTNTFTSPFIASGALLTLSYAVIRGTWNENYGSRAGSNETEMTQFTRLGAAWRIVRKDPLLLVLGLTQTCFEGSMYLFVFLWVPALQEASISYPATSPPLGYIFSSFMISMMMGSLLYTAIVSYSQRPSASRTEDSSLSLHAKLSSLVCAFSALSFACSVVSMDERVRFWAFCAFEACVGMYYPVQGMLRGTLISNEHRATLSSLFRVPLNIFVVISMLTGVSSARYAVLTASALMLAFSSIMTSVVIVGRSDAMSSDRR